MGDYLVRLRLEGPLGTPLISGTLFGHLCWAVWQTEGDDGVRAWLEENGRRPLLISDGFPAGWLPRPVLRPGPAQPRAGPPANREALEQEEKRKKAKKAAWVRVQDWLRLREGLTERSLEQHLIKREVSPPGGSFHRLAHNRIDRLTGTTPEEGGLYFVDEWWPDAGSRDWDVYVRGDLEPARLEKLFAQVGEFGYGRDGSLGRGRWTAKVGEADRQLFQFEGHRLMSLSHGTLTGNMRQARYKLHTHYGKLGGWLAGGAANPFKYPLTLLRPGATFQPGDGGPYGEMLAEVCRGHEQIRHHAFHLAIPYRELEG